MPPPDPNTLPADVRALLNEPVPEGTCWQDQPVCTPHPGVTAQLVSIAPVEVITPWRMANADAGDLLLTPGGPAGFIGAMLSELDPPEEFSHMGIFTKDGTELRHCTTSEEVLKRYPHKAGNIVAGASRTIAPDSLNEAPTDGFEENRLKFQWPGTITQTMEAAFLSSRNHGVEADPHKIHNDDLDEDFRIAALTFKPEPFPAEDGSVRMIWPVLVKTCFNRNLDERQQQAVLDAKQRVVRYVKDIRCHYRFFSYTRADVGERMDGPQVFEKTELAFNSGCTGLNGRVPVPTAATAGAQCASVIWLAVQNANKDARSGVSPAARITLDSTSIDADRVWTCEDESYLKPIRAGSDRTTNSGNRTRDGLYFYPKGERLRAAERLYNSLHDNVVKEIEGSANLQAAFDEATEGDVGKPLWVVYNILYAGIPLVLIPAMLGITDAILQALIKFFSDIPDDVATQTTNAFANDDCSQEAKDSDDWKSPGIGETVSPDATYRYWSPPTVVEPNERVVGLWGRNVIAAPPRPPVRLTHGPSPSTWQLCPGEAQIIRSRVTRKVAGNEEATGGATVRIGCTRIISSSDGTIPTTTVPAGIYWTEAWWDEPATGIRYASKGAPIEIEDASAFLRNYVLEPPPESLRAVWLHVHMDNVNRYAIGKDWWDHPDFTTNFEYLGPDLEDPVTTRVIKGGRQIDDWGHSEFELTVTLVTREPEDPGDSPRWSLRVKWKVRINAMDEDDPWREKDEFIVLPKNDPRDPGTAVEDDLSRLDVFPVRSHVRIEVHNERA